jgi:S1-C subfamily serine protease
MVVRPEKDNNEWRVATSEMGSRTSRRLRNGILFSLFAILNSPFLSAAPVPSIRADEAARVELVHRLSPSVASLFTKEDHAGGGSGVIIDPDGYGLTNFHVVAPMMPGRLGDAGLDDGNFREIEVLGIDPTGDVAMFHFTRRETFSAVSLGDSDTLRIGDGCAALGNPFGLADDFTPTVTLGIISGLHRYQAGSRGALIYSDCIQVDTSINPGNSGGPLFNLDGRLVGINGRVAIEERGRVNVGVGFAITINQIKRFIPALRAGLVPAHGSAGFTVVDHDSAVFVDQVEGDGPAYRAGLRSGDRMMRFAGADIQTANQFLSVLGTLPARWPVEIIFRHLAKIERVQIRLDALPLPELSKQRGEPHRARFDPYAATPATDRANQDAVRRAIDRYRQAIGGAEAVAAVQTVLIHGKRYLTAKPGDPPLALALTYKQPPSTTTRPAETPDTIEAAILWSLLSSDAAEFGKDVKVVGGDEVRGRIAVIVDKQGDADRSFTASFDDVDGRLLAVEFKHAAMGKRVRFEYDDYRRTGPLKLPHKRWTFLDDVLYSEDQFDSVQVHERPQ